MVFNLPALNATLDFMGLFLVSAEGQGGNCLAAQWRTRGRTVRILLVKRAAAVRLMELGPGDKRLLMAVKSNWIFFSARHSVIGLESLQFNRWRPKRSWCELYWIFVCIANDWCIIFLMFGEMN